MLNKIVHRVARRHHPWRAMQFDELAEVYTSMTLRSFGFGVIGIFVPIYFYKNGISLADIFLFYAAFFFLRVPMSFITARIIGRIGPKHTIAISTVFVVAFFGMLLTYDAVVWPLWSLAFVYSVANTLFFIGYNVDFSKIKHANHGGKELGWLYIFERSGAALGPLVGGLLASYTKPEIAIAFAMTVLVGSLIPLFMTNEPVKIHQNISFKNFKLRPHVRDFVAVSVFNIQNVANLLVWPLLLAVSVFSEDTYAKLGGLVAISLLVSIFSARMFGRFIDTSRGLALLRYGTVMNVILSVVRSFVTTPAGALAVSTLGEPVILSYRMPLVKGLYDKAGAVEKHRIVYTVWYEVFAAIAKAFLCLLVAVFCIYFDPVTVLRNSFIVLGLMSPLMLLQRFPALKS